MTAFNHAELDALENAALALPQEFDPKTTERPEIPGLSFRRNSAGAVYWQFKQDGKVIKSFGRNYHQGAAFAVAVLRAQLAEKSELDHAREEANRRLVELEQTDQAETPVLEVIRKYQKLKEKAVSPDSRDNLGFHCKHLGKLFGGYHCNAITVRDLAETLRIHAPTEPTYKKARATLVEVFSLALSEGYRAPELGNPAEMLTAPKLARPGYVKQRVRITPRQWFAVHALAPEWLKIAMEICLQTGLRRGDIARLTWDNYYPRQGLLIIKTKKTGVSLVIRVGETLAATLERARNLAGDCPFIVAKTDNRYHRGKAAKKRTHWAQALPEQISRAFQAVRDRCGAFHELGPKQRPGIHEGRSLCAWAYVDQGAAIEKSQALLGHGDKEMTEEYLKGHPQFKFAESGLDVEAMLKRSEYLDRTHDIEETVLNNLLGHHNELIEQPAKVQPAEALH